MIRIIDRKLYRAQRYFLYGAQHVHCQFGLADAFAVPHQGGGHFRVALAQGRNRSVFGNAGYIRLPAGKDNLSVPGVVAFPPYGRLQGFALKNLDRFFRKKKNIGRHRRDYNTCAQQYHKQTGQCLFHSESPLSKAFPVSSFRFQMENGAVLRHRAATD